MRLNLNLEDQVWTLLHVHTFFKQQVWSGDMKQLGRISINYFKDTLNFA